MLFGNINILRKNLILDSQNFNLNRVEVVEKFEKDFYDDTGIRINFFPVTISEKDFLVEIDKFYTKWDENIYLTLIFSLV